MVIGFLEVLNEGNNIYNKITRRLFSTSLKNGADTPKVRATSRKLI